MKKNQIVVYGTGEMAMFLASRAHPHTEIIAYLDSTRFDEYIDKIPIIAEHSLRDLDYDYVIIAFGDVELGKKKLIDLGVDESIIGAYNYSHNSNTYKQMLVQFQANFFESNNHKIVLECFDVIPTKYFLSTMRVSSELYPFIESDYVREMTLALISEQIYKKNIEGDVAEIGVYRGDFAKKNNAAFPDKTLYLVDTFDGFIESQLQSDESLRDKDYEQSKFKDTAISKVLESMPFPNNCVPVKADICQPGIQVGFDCFSFVSIDCDLYDPVYQALELFYPRLSKGGYIMIHDYNNPAYAGAMKVVDRYCQLHSLTFVPLADFCGSAVLVK